MKWGRKHSTKHNDEFSENHDNNDNDNNKKQPSTAFSLSNILPLSSWLSKLRHHHPKTNNAPAPISNQKFTTTLPPPPPKPLFSPPPLRSNSDHLAPRRLSLGHDDSSHSRANSLPRYRHYSFGSELDLSRSDSHLLDPIRTRTRTRARRRSRKQHWRPDPVDPKPIETDILQHRPRTDPDPDPIRSGRRSFSGRIRPRVRVYSPRLANVHPNPIVKERGGLERFAVVKKSSDPVRDFRESMVEMIWEKGIGRPEELESLLACYLSLNSDEHHDVIVKVFRQVWFDLNRVESGPVRVLVES